MHRLVDTHAHLVAPQFDSDRTEVLERANVAGVTRMMAVSLDLDTSRQSVELAAGHDNVFAAVGVHPSQGERYEWEGVSIRKLLNEPKVVAVGEIGLDYGRCPVDHRTQMEAFRGQIEWALDLDVPVIIHDREAHEEVMRVLAQMRPRGVLHCFSGDASLVEQASLMGMYISFAGNVTYKNAGNLPEAARITPLDRLLIETDAPYLPPEPYRGQRNEPAHVTRVAERIAGLKGKSVEEIAEAVSRNAARLFGWSQDPHD